MSVVTRCGLSLEPPPHQDVVTNQGDEHRVFDVVVQSVAAADGRAARWMETRLANQPP